MTKNKISKEMSNFSIIISITMILLMNPAMFQDKLSFLMTMLTSLFCAILLMTIKFTLIFYKNNKSIESMFSLMMMIFMASFYSSSIFLFYIFFELSVIPIFAFIMSWGSSKSKLTASYYLFFFTFFSSLMFILGLMTIFKTQGTFNLMILTFSEKLTFPKLQIYFMMMMFFVKMPILLFHIWLPLAHVESPMIGSMVLASIMLKLGGYGLHRMMAIFFSDLVMNKTYFFSWGIWGAILMSIFCLTQTDLKKTIAFSSVSHMSMILMAMFSMSIFGKWGSISMMLSHGLISSAMFYGLGTLYYRINSRNMLLLNGSLLISPTFSMWWFMIIIFNLGFPPFISFFSEFFMFLGMIILSEKFFLLGMILIMITSIYSVNLTMYLIAGLKKSTFMFKEINILENLIMLFHMYYLFSSILLIWMI